ncbi:MAG: hypothetical protein P8171_23570 [Candidatus Thiodiazotropha sp.]
MRKTIVFLLCVFPLNTFAGISTIVIAYGAGDVPVSCSMDINAEYVAMSVSLSSDAKYPSERAKLISKLQSVISSSASSDPNIEFQQGIISLSPQEKSSFSISSSYSRNSGSSFYLLSKLSNEKGVYAATQDIYSFIERIQKPADTSLSLGNTSLAVRTPEQYRNQLLEKVKDEIILTKKILGSGYKVSISGLENPVVVRQKDDKQVTVFIDYRIELSE